MYPKQVNIKENLPKYFIHADNSNYSRMTNSTFWTYIYPIITLIIGSLLTYFTSYFESRRQENKELFRYEYTLLTDILDILTLDQKEEKMLKLYNEEKRNPNFMKIEDYKLIMQLIKKIS